MDNESPKANGGIIEETVQVNSAPASVSDNEQALLSAVSLPSSYNSVNYGYVPAAQDQGSHNLCWAFTQANLAAINVKKDEGKTVNYSKLHMAYALSDDYGNDQGFYRYVDEGGNRTMSIAYLVRGSGMVHETEDPYLQTDFPYRAPSATNGYFSTGYLEAAPMLNDASVTQIKELIYEYGAVGCSIYFDDYYYNSSTKMYYYYGPNSSNHAVTLVGWDDSRSAFIAQNSWGTDWGNNGFFYISYSDSLVKDTIFATDYEADDLPFDGIRSYNNFGQTSYVYSDEGETFSYSTTYETGDARTLEGVGTYILEANTKVEVYLNPYNGDGKANAQFKKVHTQTFATPGYYHISFDNAPYLYGSKFNVRIKITSTTGGIVRAPFQRDIGNFLYKSVFHPGTTYFGSGNNPTMTLVENIYSDASSVGWAWSMQAFTKSDLELDPSVGVITTQGESDQLTIPKNQSSAVLRVTRNGKQLPLYTNNTCKTALGNTTVYPGNTYYLKLENGTHIRRAVKVAKSNSSATESLLYVNGKRPDANNSFTFTISSKTFAPTVDTFFNDNWALYALPDGVGRIGKSMTVSLYRTKVYLRVVESDGVTINEYPITIYGPQSSTSGIKDWSKVGSWAKENVKTAVKYSLISGDSNGNLNPKGNLTRAQAASMLVRFAGMESSKIGMEHAAIYADVGLSKWYAPAISTAGYIEMISGHSNPGYRCFSPDKAVTREQYASMMIRLLAYTEGVDVNTYINRYLPSAESFVKSKNYADLGNVSSWATDSMKVALYLGIFSGATKNGRLYINPKSNITREQTAVTMANSLDLL